VGEVEGNPKVARKKKDKKNHWIIKRHLPQAEASKRTTGYEKKERGGVGVLRTRLPDAING